MRYGELPISLGIFDTVVAEIMTYQYLPIKLANQHKVTLESRLEVFNKIIGVACCDFIGAFGLNRYINNYIYVTAKHRFVSPECPMNRQGYHSDSFLSDDINYIWSDCFPTIFNCSNFLLSEDDRTSLTEMEQQADWTKEVSYKPKELLRLNQYNIHKVAPVTESRMRTFLKVSFSRERYNLVGNSHNYLLDYKWNMKRRSADRNVPNQ